MRRCKQCELEYNFGNCDKEDCENNIRNRINALLRPVMQVLRDNFHPHVKIVLDSENAEILEGLFSLHLKND